MVRLGDVGAGVVIKEPLGPDGARRLAHENDMLRRLAGVQGVGLLVAAAVTLDGVLTLQDHGGTTLAQLLGAGPVETARVVALAAQLARTLAAVHRAGIIHRDINPTNILLLASGDAVLIDFDLALLVDQLSGASPQDGIVGTLAYLAPEQSGRTGHAVDQRADLYALGATLYEMATGRVPFEASDTLELIHDHLVREPVEPAHRDARVPNGLSAIIMRLMAKAPEQRYHSAEGLLHDLQRLRQALVAGGEGLFELGERDFAARLAAPQRLVGRDAELALLGNALADALQTPRRTVLIEGAAGVGKSALMNELRPLAQAAGGWFVHGKFDQFRRDIATTGGLVQALRSLGRIVLAQSRHELALQRRRILDSLGPNAGLITRLSPELALLLGPQPDVPVVDPRLVELQMQQAMVDLLGVIASPERPLVAVIDDLQWAPAIDLRALERLMCEPGLRGLLLVCAFRTEEPEAGDVLPPMLANWRQLRQVPTEIRLANLAAHSVGEIVGQMLRLEDRPAQELGQAVGELTGGNPFDTVEMVNAMRRQGVLSLGESGWQWDEANVRHFVGRGNVVDLLATRIARLPVASRLLLECMSCLSNIVDCKLLMAAMGLDDAELRTRLRAPVEDGLVVADTSEGQDNVRFRHDRVQQTVLAAMEDSRGVSSQLAMARRLAGARVFGADAAQLYLAGTGQIIDPDEQQLVAQLFYRMAQKLARTATWVLVERYLAAALQLLEPLCGPADSKLLRDIVMLRHAALYSLGRLDELDQVFEAMQSWQIDLLERIEPACLQMRSLDMRGRMAQTMQLGRQLLALLGLDVPADYSAADTSQRLDALNDWVRRDRLLDHATRPQIQDPHVRATARLLERMVRSALVLFEEKAIVWLLLEGQRLWAEHGPCPELVACQGRMSGMLIGLRQDYRTAYNVAQHVLHVGEALGYEPQTSEARFVFATYAAHWFEPLEDAFRQVTLAFEGVQAQGDASFASYVHLVLFTDLVEIAPTIDVTLAELDTGIALCQRTGNIHAAALHASLRQALRALGGLTQPPGGFDDAQFSAADFLARMGRLPFVENAYAECRAMYSLIMGEADVLSRTADLGLARRTNLAGYYMTVYAHFFVAMARAWEVQPATRAQARTQTANTVAGLAELQTCRDWLAARAADQPHNYLHLLRLVEAEQAWALGDLWQAATSYDAALIEAESRRRPWHRAVITERAGLFHLTRGFAHTGRKLLAEACNQYRTWGASVKVSQMQDDHEFLQAPQGRASAPGGIAAGYVVRSSSSVSPDALDMMGVLRASQALSSETGLEPLMARVT